MLRTTLAASLLAALVGAAPAMAHETTRGDAKIMLAAADTATGGTTKAAPARTSHTQLAMVAKRQHVRARYHRTQRHWRRHVRVHRWYRHHRRVHWAVYHWRAHHHHWRYWRHHWRRHHWHHWRHHPRHHWRGHHGRRYR
jgi:hypothetical protein